MMPKWTGPYEIIELKDGKKCKLRNIKTLTKKICCFTSCKKKNYSRERMYNVMHTERSGCAAAQLAPPTSPTSRLH